MKATWTEGLLVDSKNPGTKGVSQSIFVLTASEPKFCNKTSIVKR